MRTQVKGLRRATVAIGVSLALGAGAVSAPAQEVEFGSSVEDPYAAGPQLPKMQSVRVGNVVLPGELVGVASVAGVLAIIATIVAMTSKTPGGSSGAGGSSRIGLKPDEYRADNGTVYKVNPQARNVSTQQAAVLFPGGADEIGSTITLSNEEFAQLGLRAGDVLSIPPSAKFPGAALAKILKVEQGEEGVTVVTKPGILDDVIEYTKGEVKFDGVLYTAEPMKITDPVTGVEIDAVQTADAGREAQLKLEADMKKLAKAKKIAGADALSEAKLTGTATFTTQLGLDKESTEKEADKSFELTTKLNVNFNAKTSAKVDLGEDLGKIVEKELQKRFSATRQWTFPAGPVWIYLETGIEPTFASKLSAESAWGITLDASKEQVIGYKFDASEDRLEQISREVSPAKVTSDLKNGEVAFTAKIEPGAQVTAGLWKTFNGALGASLEAKAERKKEICDATLTLNAPKGEITVESPTGALLGDWAALELFKLKLKNEALKKKWDLGCADKDSGVTTESEGTEVSDELKRKMLNMQIPAVCGHNGGRLHDGRLEESAITYTGGFVDIRTRVGESVDAPRTVNAKQITVDGEERILLVAQCFAGGVGWPQSLFLLDKDLNFVGVGENRSGLQVDPQRPLARRPFYVFDTEGDTVHLKYGAADEGDAMAAPSLLVEGTYRVDGQRLTPVSTPRVEKMF